MSINQEVVVYDDGVRRLGRIVGFDGEYVTVRLAGLGLRRFWIEQVRTV